MNKVGMEKVLTAIAAIDRAIGKIKAERAKIMEKLLL
jgi:hypothetical protein